MDTARKDGISRRDLLVTGTITGLASVLTGSPSAAQTGAMADEKMPVKWTASADDGSPVSFKQLEQLHYGQRPPPAGVLAATDPGEKIPGKREYASWRFRNCANPVMVNKWHQQVQAYGPASAAKQVELTAHDAQGGILSQYQLTGCVPIEVSNKGPNTSLITTTAVRGVRLVCRRAEPQSLGSSAPRRISGARFALELFGEVVAEFLEVVEIIRDIDEEDAFSKDASDDPPLSEEPGKGRSLRLKLGKGRDFDHFIWKWLQDARTLSMQEVRRALQLVLYDAYGNVNARYHCANAWPDHVEVGSKVLSDSQTLYNVLTISCDSIVQD